MVSAWILPQSTGCREALAAPLVNNSKSNGAGPLERYIPMFLSRHGVHFVLEHAQRADDFRARLARLDHIIDESALGGGEGVREAVAKFRDFFTAQSISVPGGGQLSPVNDVHRSLRPHHRDLRRWPGEVNVGADVLRPHDAISSSVRFARDYRNFRNGCLGVREQQLGAVADDTAEFL